jgi:hypothetical protein
MKYSIYLITLFIFYLSGCAPVINEEEKMALNSHLDRVIGFEKKYISQLEKIKTKEVYIKAFNQVREEVLKFNEQREDLEKKHPYFKSFHVQVKKKFPKEFEDKYIDILNKRLDISRKEYKLTVKFKARELDTPDVFILGNTIKDSVFIEH